jgi:hypothetical protein
MTKKLIAPLSISAAVIVALPGVTSAAADRRR